MAVIASPSCVAAIVARRPGVAGRLSGKSVDRDPQDELRHLDAVRITRGDILDVEQRVALQGEDRVAEERIRAFAKARDRRSAGGERAPVVERLASAGRRDAEVELPGDGRASAV